jgi:hypothetical protein
MEPTVGDIKWSEVHACFERQHESLLENDPDAAQEIAIIRTVLIKMKQLAKESLPAIEMARPGEVSRQS